MSLRQYLQVLRARWYMVVAGLIIGGMLSAAYLITSTATYTANAQLFISTSSQTSLAEISAGGTFVQNQVKSYASVVSTPALTEPVIAELGLPYTPSQLAAEISATAPTNTVLIQLSVKDEDAGRAAAIANAVATRLAAYISQLETPLGQAKSPVKATVTQPAGTPSSPSSPKPKLDVIVGLFLGILAGGGVAILLELLDNRVGNRVDVAAAAGAPVVGAVGDDPLASKKPLILLDDAFSPRAESFRQLRTNVRFLGVERMLRSVVITGSVADEGKSLTAANLAVALAQAGDAVTLVDADLRRPTVAATFGLSAAVGLTSVLVGNVSVDDAVQTWRDDLPLRILTSGPIPPNPSELLGSSRLHDLIDELLKVSDIVLFDSPPLLPVTDAALLARATDGALVVARSRSTRVTQLVAATAALRAADAAVLGIVLNRVPKKSRLVGYGTYGGTPEIDSGGYEPLTNVHPPRRRSFLDLVLRRPWAWLGQLLPDGSPSAPPAARTQQPQDDRAEGTYGHVDATAPAPAPVMVEEVRDALRLAERMDRTPPSIETQAGRPDEPLDDIPVPDDKPLDDGAVPSDEGTSELYVPAASAVPEEVPYMASWPRRPPPWAPAVSADDGLGGVVLSVPVRASQSEPPTESDSSGTAPRGGEASGDVNGDDGSGALHGTLVRDCSSRDEAQERFRNWLG